MATSCIIYFKDKHGDTVTVYQHWDGNLETVQANLEKAKEYAWPLPRYEASDMAAAYVAANKPKGGGDIRIGVDIDPEFVDTFTVEAAENEEDGLVVLEGSAGTP